MNTLEQKLQSDLVEAMKAKDEIRKNTIKSVKTAITKLKTAEKDSIKEPTDNDIIKLISKLAKERQESGEIYKSNNKPELAEVEFKELEILNTYLPKKLTDEEIEKVVETTISELGVSDIKGIGLVIKTITGKYTGQVDGGKVSKIVKEKLTK